MNDHVKPTIRDDKPDHAIMYTGTNDLRSEKTASRIARYVTELAMLLKDNDNGRVALWLATYARKPKVPVSSPATTYAQG